MKVERYKNQSPIYMLFFGPYDKTKEKTMKALIIVISLILSTNAFSAITEVGTNLDKSNNEIAFQKNTLLALRGYASAQYQLGMMYRLGQGTNKDQLESIRWFTESAEQNNADAQRTLGAMYKSGQYTDQDYDTAIHWYMRAANQGDVFSQNIIGSMYQRGEVVTQNYVTAMGWYYEAAKQNYGPAQHNIGLMYENAQISFGIHDRIIHWFMGQNHEDLSKVRAHMWYRLADWNRHTAAWASLNRVEAEMTEDQMKQSQELANRCAAKQYRGYPFCFLVDFLEDL